MRIDREALRTGIPLIDRQHEAYFGLVECLFGVAERGHVDRAELDKAVAEVIRYAVEHFDAEEFLMRSANYPATREHSAKHAAFREQANNLVDEYRGRTDVDVYAIRLNNLLVDWFTDQVRTDDRQLAAFLKTTRPP